MHDNLLKELFEMISQKPNSENPMYSDEINSRENAVFDKYLPDIKEDAAARSDAELDFVTLFWDYAEKGFIAGFNAAKELIR